MSNIKILKSNRSRQASDLEAIWSDPQGNRWKITLNWKTSHSSGGINEISIVAYGHTAGITTRLLRQLPLGELGQHKRDHDIKKGLAFESDHAQQGGHRRVAVTDTELKKVSRLYYEAKTNGDSVQKYIAFKFNISIPTAARRIGLAQQRGFITSTKGDDNE
jgi:hypothetical protein